MNFLLESLRIFILHAVRERKLLNERKIGKIVKGEREREIEKIVKGESSHTLDEITGHIKVYHNVHTIVDEKAHRIVNNKVHALDKVKGRITINFPQIAFFRLN